MTYSTDSPGFGLLFFGEGAKAVRWGSVRRRAGRGDGDRSGDRTPGEGRWWRRRERRSKDDDVAAAGGREGEDGNDGGVDVSPLKATEAASELRNGDRGDPAHDELASEGSGGELDVGKLGAIAKAAFGRHGDAVPRKRPGAEVVDQYGARVHVAVDAGGPVAGEMLGVSLLEGECQPAAHDADAVHGVDEGMDGSSHGSRSGPSLARAYGEGEVGREEL